MAIYQKRYYWGRKPYNSKTGLYQGETRFSTGVGTTDWKGRTVEPVKTSKRGMGANGYDD